MCARCCFPLIFVKALVPPVWWKIWEVWIQWLCWGSWALEIPALTLSKLFSQQKVRLVFFFVLNKSWALFKVVMAHDSLNSGKFYLTNIHEYFIISSVSFFCCPNTGITSLELGALVAQSLSCLMLWYSQKFNPWFRATECHWNRSYLAGSDNSLGVHCTAAVLVGVGNI